MGKSDFNLDEDFYSQNTEIENNNSSDVDFSDFGTVEYNDVIDDSSVVYEENANETSEEKVKYFLSTLNPRMLLVMGFVLLILVFCFIIIFSSIKKNNSLYYSEVLIPDVVYVGETFSMTVINHAKGSDDVSKAVVSFENSNSMILEMLDKESGGAVVNNTIIPVMEGKTKISVKATLGKKKLTDYSKEVVVCPSFDSGLVLGGSISLVKDNVYRVNIDFGDKRCSEGISYESSNKNVMTVDASGNIKGNAVGTTILTVKKGNHSFSVPVYVTSKAFYIDSFNVTPKAVRLVAGQTKRIKILSKPLYTTSKNYIFKSSNENVVSVSDSGFIKALKKGKATIRVSDFFSRVEEIIDVVVYDNNTNNVNVTDIKVSDDEITLLQGSSSKIDYELIPGNASNKNLSINSSNNSIVSVTQNGVIYAKGTGSAVITLRTANGISKSINVNVVAIKAPVIKASDGIGSGKWHTKHYTLKFTGSNSGVTYYYGLTKDAMNKKANQVIVSKDESRTYYVKACLNNACSSIVSYSSKADLVKPKILAVAGIESVNVSEDSVHIAISDSTSLVSSWCVTFSNDYNDCKWNNISRMANPTVTYVAKRNDNYYAFAKDSAGNISDGYSFSITNIG